MSKKNYNKISTEAAKANVEAETVESVVEEAVITAEPIVEVAPKEKVIYGVVDNCARLNVRSKPSTKSEVICVIPAGLKVVVSKMGTTGGFYEVHSVDNGEATEGFHGFCMKKYITIKK